MIGAAWFASRLDGWAGQRLVDLAERKSSTSDGVIQGEQVQPGKHRDDRPQPGTGIGWFFPIPL